MFLPGEVMVAGSCCCWGGVPLGTRQTLGLFIFPLVSMVTYLAFINAQDVARWRDRLARFRRRSDSEIAPLAPIWHQRLALAFPATLLVTAVLGVELEHQLDPYGLRRPPKGPHELVEIDPDRVEAMLESNAVIRPEDLVHSLEMGEMLIGGYVVGHKRTFRQGEKLFAQCTLNPPHPDLMIECNLQTATTDCWTGSTRWFPGKRFVPIFCTCCTTRWRRVSTPWWFGAGARKSSGDGSYCSRPGCHPTGACCQLTLAGRRLPTGVPSCEVPGGVTRAMWLLTENPWPLIVVLSVVVVGLVTSWWTRQNKRLLVAAAVGCCWPSASGNSNDGSSPKKNVSPPVSWIFAMPSRPRTRSLQGSLASFPTPNPRSR
ncbi:MAG: hypothetical protein Ct9H300mP1_06720 [Planctomycetaceae bacterium]|nr:MAG: hypothetical protein Ct9H300mP1_06720 [Planctomycetaceae bacterium]